MPAPGGTRTPAPSPPAPTARRSRVVAGSPVYYGWLILLAGTVGMVMTIPGQTVGVSVFLDKIIADLEVSRATVSLLYTVGTLVGSLALPFVGRFIDRRGPRLAVVAIAAAFALACAWMSGVGGLWTLAVGFVLIRGLGQGSLSLVSMHVINLWFVRRRGFAIGVTGLGFALATAVFPLFLERLIGGFGWRGAYALLGALVTLTILPLGALLFRGHPERYGLQPDSGRADRATPPPERNASLAEARRSAAFWLIVAGDACVAALSTGLVFHHYDIMAAAGLDRVAAAAVFVPLGLVTAAANLSTGLLFDRLPPRLLLALMLLLQGAALALAGFGSGGLGGPLLALYGGLLGATQGMKGALSGGIYAHYFGRASLGSIKGLATTLTVAGTAVGPLLFAVGLDASGSYRSVLLASAALPAALALASLFLRPPRTPPAARSTARSRARPDAA